MCLGPHQCHALIACECDHGDAARVVLGFRSRASELGTARYHCGTFTLEFHLSFAVRLLDRICK